MQELFEAVRAACPSGLWSKAVELVRRFAVTQQADSAPEPNLPSDPSQPVTCRVHYEDRAIPATVQLYPEDAEWDCDCGSRAPCCEHVAAAVIALKKARAEGKPLPGAMTSAANLGYHFVRFQGELRLERRLIRPDGSRIPLRMSLSSAVTQHAAGVDFAPSQTDLQIDRLIGNHGQVRPEQVLPLLRLLIGHKNIEFEDRAAEVQTEALRPRATVSVRGNGFLLQVGPDPSIQQVVASHVGWTGSALVALGATEYFGPKYEKLVPERFFGPDEVATLVTEVLPELKRWCALDVQTDRLPVVTDEERPRIVLDVRQQDDQLSVLATLVYGDPAIARIDRNRLLHLEGPIPMRNQDLERRALEHLRQSLGLVTGSRTVVTGKEAVHLATKLDHWRGEIVGSEPERWIHETTLRPRLTRGDLLPRFYAKTADGVELVASSNAAVKSYRNGQGHVPLLDGGFARLPMDWLAQNIALLERLLAADPVGDPPRLPAHAAPTLAALYQVLNAPLPPDLAPARHLLGELAELPEASLPTDLTVTPRPYQRQGIAWLQLLARLGLGALLADDMGLGKTLQVLCALSGRTLVICPTSLIANWHNELGRLRPALTVSIYHGKDRQIVGDADVTLTSYALLRLDQEQLLGQEWDTAVLDEAQQIKNNESQVAQAAYALRARFRIALTGTPIENRLEDLWSAFQFTNPGLLGPRDEFCTRYTEAFQNASSDRTEQFRQIIRPFVLRRTKREVLPDLPARLERDLYFDLDDQERELYQALYQLTQRELSEQVAQAGNTFDLLKLLLRLRQAACHPSLVPGQSAVSSSKVRLLLDRLLAATADGHKSLVFSQWTSFLDLVEPELRATNLSFLRLDGSTTDRGSVVDRFQNDAGTDVLLLSLKAGGTGLNLTAADHVFLLDLWWNPAVEQQAADRAHRLGQEHPVFIHRLIAKDTVEERIVALQAQKRALFDAVLEDSGHAAALSRDELLALLE